ncbi:unnamed protein product [Lupinus luteus]|uniref:Uncharacterized protein n=1 Tax=Lupinus luteus TaxID=3873 RepID=A0AAV1XUM6_LUPLU
MSKGGEAIGFSFKINIYSIDVTSCIEVLAIIEDYSQYIIHETSTTCFTKALKWDYDKINLEIPWIDDLAGLGFHFLIDVTTKSSSHGESGS